MLVKNLVIFLRTKVFCHGLNHRHVQMNRSDNILLPKEVPRLRRVKLFISSLSSDRESCCGELRLRQPPQQKNHYTANEIDTLHKSPPLPKRNCVISFAIPTIGGASSNIGIKIIIKLFSSESCYRHKIVCGAKICMVDINIIFPTIENVCNFYHGMPIICFFFKNPFLKRKVLQNYQ